MLPVSTHSAFCLSCRRLFRTSYGLTPNIWWVFHLETRLLSLHYLISQKAELIVTFLMPSPLRGITCAHLTFQMRPCGVAVCDGTTGAIRSARQTCPAPERPSPQHRDTNQNSTWPLSSKVWGYRNPRKGGTTERDHPFRHATTADYLSSNFGSPHFWKCIRDLCWCSIDYCDMPYHPTAVSGLARTKSRKHSGSL